MIDFELFLKVIDKLSELLTYGEPQQDTRWKVAGEEIYQHFTAIHADLIRTLTRLTSDLDNDRSLIKVIAELQGERTVLHTFRNELSKHLNVLSSSQGVTKYHDFFESIQFYLRGRPANHKSHHEILRILL